MGRCVCLSKLSSQVTHIQNISTPCSSTRARCPSPHLRPPLAPVCLCAQTPPQDSLRCVFLSLFFVRACLNAPLPQQSEYMSHTRRLHVLCTPVLIARFHTVSDPCSLSIVVAVPRCKSRLTSRCLDLACIQHHPSYAGPAMLDCAVCLLPVTADPRGSRGPGYCEHWTHRGVEGARVCPPVSEVTDSCPPPPSCLAASSLASRRCRSLACAGAVGEQSNRTRVPPDECSCA